MIKAATMMAAARMQRSQLEHFLIRRLREISCAQEQALDQERVIREVTDITPGMTVNIKGVQGQGLNPSGDILPRPSLFTDSTCDCIGHWI